MANINLRLERPEDYRAVEELTYRAFLTADPNIPGVGTEALLAHKLRDDRAFVAELDFVAERDGEIVGNIMYTQSRVVAGDGRETATLTFGPLSVKPQYHGQGIGAMLVRHTLELARARGHRAVIIFGHEGYYPRFGFAPAARYGISTADGENFDAFMALPLYDGALDGVSGSFRHAPVFDGIDRAESDAFNAQFHP